MMRGDPAFHEFDESRRLPQDFLGFGLRSDGGVVTIDHIALAPAVSKKSRELSAADPRASRAVSKVSR